MRNSLKKNKARSEFVEKLNIKYQACEFENHRRSLLTKVQVEVKIGEPITWHVILVKMGLALMASKRTAFKKIII